MTPLEEIYHLLSSKLKLSKDQIDKSVETNTYIRKVIAPDIYQVIKKFEEFGLSDKEIAEIANKNPWMLTESFERIKYLKQFYGLVGLTEYRELLINQPIAMSVNPIEVKELIERFKSEGRTDEEIREILINDFTKYITLTGLVDTPNKEKESVQVEAKIESSETDKRKKGPYYVENTKFSRIALSQVYEILMEYEDGIENIPPNIIKFLEDNKDPDYIFDYGDDLENFVLEKDAENILTYLYSKYLESEEE